MPSPSLSKNAHPSPVFEPVHPRSSKFHLIWKSLPVPHDPASLLQNFVMSFCPGSSSGPCASITQLVVARAALAGRMIATARVTAMAYRHACPSVANTKERGHPDGLDA